MAGALVPGSGDTGPKLEAAFSPRLFVLLGAVIALLALLWRIAGRH
jgi:hypothetical protein